MATSNLYSTYKPANFISIKDLQENYQPPKDPVLVEGSANKYQSHYKYPPKPSQYINQIYSAEQTRHKKMTPSDPTGFKSSLKDQSREMSQIPSDFQGGQQRHFKIGEPSELEDFMFKSDWLSREVAFSVEPKSSSRGSKYNHSFPSNEDRNAFQSKGQSSRRNLSKPLEQAALNKRSQPETRKDSPVIYKTPQDSPNNPESRTEGTGKVEQGNHFVFPGQTGKPSNFHYVGPYETDSESRQLTESNTQRSRESVPTDRQFLFIGLQSQIPQKPTASNFKDQQKPKNTFISYYCSVMEDDVDSDDQAERDLIEEEESNVSRDNLMLHSAKRTDALFNNPAWNE